MPEDKLKNARIVSLIASTLVALSCGTNYVYSAYAPQLAERLQLSATQSGLIGTFGNLGMYLSGIPAGILVDSKGPRLATFIGALALFCGYYPIYRAYLAGPGSMSVVTLCFFSTITGAGSCCGFGAAMKAAALNFPSHRGTATALPLSAFGLSAFFFSILSSTLFPGNTGSFLLLLSVGTSSIVFVAFFFLRIIPVPNAYAALPPTRPPARDRNNKLHRTKSTSSRESQSQVEVGVNYTTISSRPARAAPNGDEVITETSSILSSSSSSEDLEPYDEEANGDNSSLHAADVPHFHGHHIDVRGWALTRRVEFWLLFTVLGLLTGVGLMTINNIGHSVQALWAKYAPDTEPHYVQTRQAMHVSILSLFSFSGRIISGVSSDVLHKKYRSQRLWMVTCSGVGFCFAQFLALTVENPHWLFLVSSLSGFSYGMLFGAFPTIVSEVFGIHGFSQNWGTMTISAVISGQIFNLIYGMSHNSTLSLNDIPLFLSLYNYSFPKKWIFHHIPPPFTLTPHFYTLL
ncbi:major facilitator superfamily domain-containing protein [Peziza echinospora]|nr:major facilitator superfamily domain-containing protein [Peziza echinospora]